MSTTCRLFSETSYRLPLTSYLLFEISRYARNDGVVYETESAAASLFRAKREIPVRLRL